MRSICMIVLFAVFAAIDAQESQLYPTLEAPPQPFPTAEAGETVEPQWDPTSAPSGGNPAVMRGWPNQQQQPDDQEAPDSEESREEVDTTDAPDAQYAPDAQDAPDAFAGAAGQSSGQQAGAPVNFFNMGAGGKPFKGFKKPTAQDAQTIAGKTIGIILSTLFLAVVGVVVAVIVIRRRRSA